MKKYIVMAIIAIGFGCTPSFAQDQHQNRDNVRHDNGGDRRDNGGDHRDNGRNVHHRQTRHRTSSRYRHSGDNRGGDNRQMSGDHRNDGRK